MFLGAKSRKIDGEKVFYKRGLPDNEVTHAMNYKGRRPGYIIFDLNDINYNHKTNTGVKGKEILAHELGHVKDMRDYSGMSSADAEREQEIEADVNMAKRCGHNLRDYKRINTEFRRRVAKNTMLSPQYKMDSIDGKINQKDYALDKSPHGLARNKVYTDWKRLGLKENLNMSFIKFLNEVYLKKEGKDGYCSRAVKESTFTRSYIQQRKH